MFSFFSKTKPVPKLKDVLEKYPIPPLEMSRIVQLYDNLQMAKRSGEYVHFAKYALYSALDDVATSMGAQNAARRVGVLDIQNPVQFVYFLKEEFVLQEAE